MSFFFFFYLRLGLQGQLQLLAVRGWHAGLATGHFVKLGPALFGLVLANQPQEPRTFCPAHGTFIKGAIEQSHRQPHHWRHQGAQRDLAQDVEEAAAVAPGEDLPGVHAAAGEESPGPAVQEEAQDQQDPGGSKQEDQPVGRVLAAAGALERHEGKETLAPQGQQSHEAVANHRFLVQDEPDNPVESIHFGGG